MFAEVAAAALANPALAGGLGEAIMEFAEAAQPGSLPDGGILVPILYAVVLSGGGRGMMD